MRPELITIALSAQTGGRFSPAGLEKFAQQLRDDYVPVMLGNITTKFESLSKPTIPNLKIGLNLIHRPDKKDLAGAIISNGRRYTLEINLGHLKNTPQGEVITDGVFYSYITHEFMHAVMFDVVSVGMLGETHFHGGGSTEVIDQFPTWFIEGTAQMAGAGGQYPHDLTQGLLFVPDREPRIKDWLKKFDYLGR